MIRILGKEEVLRKGLHCRPLKFTGGDFGGQDYTQQSSFGGVINNFKWILVEEVLGECWLDGKHTIEDYEKGPSMEYEYVEGNIPEGHKTTRKQLKELEGLE